MIQTKKWILDTDIGDDIDDALALALGLSMPELDLLGITTVFLDTGKRARIARRLLSLYGRADIPVYAGMRQSPGDCKPIDNVPCQYEAALENGAYEPLNDVYTDGGAAAVDYICEMARRYGSALTIVAIGPLTNLAAAIQKDPAAMRSLGGIVLMGGCFSRQFCEWNIVCDAEGAKTVLESGCRVTCIGHEVTEQTLLTEAEQERISSSVLDEKRVYLSQLVRMYTAYTGHRAMLHDPLTVYYLARPDILQTEDIHVFVETKGEHTRGMTVNMNDICRFRPKPWPGALITAATAVDKDRFLADFFQMVFA